MFDHFAQPSAPAAPPPPPQKVLRFDRGYWKTLPGILQLTQLASNTLGFICITVSGLWLSRIFFNILYWVGNIVTLVLFLSYMFHAVEKFERWPWHKCEFAFCGALALAYVGTSIFAATLAESVGYAVGFFGLVAVIAYGFDGYRKYRGWKRGLPAQ